jgi:ADP-ribosylglycohydrolase
MQRDVLERLSKAELMIGLAVGDAVGTTLEFRERDSYAPLTEMVSGGPFPLPPGSWTDNTAIGARLRGQLGGARAVRGCPHHAALDGGRRL